MNDEARELRARLWNSAVSSTNYEGSGEKYQAAILDQYRLYVEMADRVSHRRGLANTFFVTANSAVFTLAGVFWKDGPKADTWVLALPLVVALAQCVAWWCLVRSYRLLNSAKFQVVGVLEERLPASPYSRAEWVALGEGRDWRKYLPLSHLEQWIPIIFGLVYVLGFLVALLA